MSGRDLSRRIRDFDDGGTPEWRARGHRGIRAWYRRATPMQVYAMTTLVLGAGVILFVIGAFGALILYDALT